ncbi:patatin-like phospholipase family protein [Maribellus sp. YY47]|uniref:patatin-like phospholipase family protein n=1 Tax=Maribellus sp. YY47 TaxID=2929486 RepID=UPI0020019090|nr:patatin-like phospholipase family protein [Maribellus sp. YY47]MCK3683923.1 patatin-like phospholipase family protein [Maribellus sp. YY47]
MTIGILISFSAYAQQTDQSIPKKPKIGLVLSGGGAKGLAHIGVIKVLEEAGIRPDIITGTSMGSIIGALYACGYTVDELSAINENADWKNLLTDKEVLQKVSMEEKKETNKYIFVIPISDNKIRLPAGMIEGQHLEAYFSELLWPLTSEQSFDSLPIPFHCMSVDIISGNVVEHASGNLVEAIRASMAIPTVFTPVDLDSMLLVDGGVARNFPVQEALDMGADIIIGVYVGFPEEVTKAKLNTVPEILSRSIALAGIVDAREQNEKVDILIIPELYDYGSSDFLNGPAIQQLGEITAREKLDQLKELADSLDLQFKPVSKIKQPRRIKVAGIEVEGLQFIGKDYVVSKSGIAPGDSVSFNDVREAIEYMHGSPYFNKISFSLKKGPGDDDYILVFQVKENPRVMFKFTPNYDNDMGVGLVTNFTLLNVVMPSSRLLFTTHIAENPALRLEMNKLLGNQQKFSNHYFFNLSDYKHPMFVNGDELGNYKYFSLEGGYGIHYAPGLNHILGLNGIFRYNRISPMEDLKSIYDAAGFARHASKEWGYKFFYRLNTTDDLYFPGKGVRLNLSFSHVLSTKVNRVGELHNETVDYVLSENNGAYATMLADYNWYKTIDGFLTFDFGLNAGFNTTDPGVGGMLLLGGERFNAREIYRNIAGFNTAELFTYNMAFAKAELNARIVKGLYLSTTLNVGNVNNTFDGLVDNFREPVTDYIWGYNFGVKYSSLIGPIQLLVGGNNLDSKTRFFLSVGFPF